MMLVRWMMISQPRVLLLLLVLGISFQKKCLADDSSLQFEGMILQPGCAITGITVPIADDSGGSILSFYIGEILLEPTRLGFLRINLLPQVAVRDCQLVIQETCKDWGEPFAQFVKQNRVLDHTLIKEIRIEWKGEQQPIVLKAQSGRFLLSEGRIALDGCILRTGSVNKSFPAASLRLGGLWSEIRQAANNSPSTL